MLIDLHAYTSASGGHPVDRVIADALTLGLDAIVVADKGASADIAARAADLSSDDLRVFVGVELATMEGDVLVIGPKLDPFYTREEWKQIGVLGKPKLAQVVELASKEGAVVLMTHPYDRERKSAPRDRIFSLDGIDGVEVATHGSDGLANKVAVESIGSSTYSAFAGSALTTRTRPNSHWVTLLGRAVTTQEELVEALRVGDFWPVEIRDQSSGGGSRGGSRRDDRGERGGRGGRGDRGDRGDRRGGGGGGGRRGGRRRGGERSRS